jgi:hypothetical protein
MIACCQTVDVLVHGKPVDSREAERHRTTKVVEIVSWHLRERTVDHAGEAAKLAAVLCEVLPPETLAALARIIGQTRS